MADRSDFGWKTVGEYLDNELADNDDDAKKMKKAKKEAQRKIADARASKMAKSRASFSRLPRPVSRNTEFISYSVRSSWHQQQPHIYNGWCNERFRLSWPGQEKRNVFQLWKSRSREMNVRY